MNAFPSIRYLPVPLTPVPLVPEFSYSSQFLLPGTIAPGHAVRLFMRVLRDLTAAQPGSIDQAGA